MAISSVPRKRPRPRAALLLPAALAFAFAAAAGGARLGPRPPEPPAPRRTVTAAGVGAQAPSAGSTVSGPPTGSEVPTPYPAEQSPGRDPSEEITPEELAAISEPVSPPGGVSPRVKAKTPAAGSGRGSQAGSARAEAVRPGSSFLWRVQVFVTQDRALADRKAREAVERLQARAHVAHEAPYYKVRLGDYASEEEAQPLRLKALFSGYPGAFRVRCYSDTTYQTD